MRLPDKVSVKCGLCGAEHFAKVTYSQEIRNNRIIITIHTQLSEDFTQHVAERHLDLGLPQVLTPRGAEDVDAQAGDGEGAMDPDAGKEQKLHNWVRSGTSTPICSYCLISQSESVKTPWCPSSYAKPATPQTSSSTGSAAIDDELKLEG